jgi:NADH dehydrogenase
MSCFTRARNFRLIDSKLARVILVEAGPGILPMIREKLAGRAVRELKSLVIESGLRRELDWQG